MKTLTLISLAVFGLSAHALKMTHADFKAKIKNKSKFAAAPSKKMKFVMKDGKLDSVGTYPGQGGSAQPVEPGPELPPTRTGRMKVEIFKVQVIRNPDDSISFSQTSICTKEGDYNIWDFRNTSNHPGYLNYGPGVTCSSTVEGLPVEVTVNGYGYISSWEYFQEGVQSDRKLGGSFMEVKDNNGTPSQWGGGSLMISRDLATKSMIGDISGYVLEVCTPVNDGSNDVTCNILTDEYFVGTYELIDNP